MSCDHELRVGRGYTREWVIDLKYAWGTQITDVYDGSEVLDLVVCTLTGETETLTDSTVEWAVVTRDARGNPLSAVAGSGGGEDGTILLHLDDTDTELMEAGPRGISIGLTVGGERLEAFRGTLRVEARPVS